MGDIKKSGIYVIKNLVNGKVYVGSAVKIVQRWAEHRSMLKRGVHHSVILQNSWIKHGELAFSFNILEIVESPEFLIAREQFWIDYLDSANKLKGFNINPLAASSLGTKRTPEAIARIVAGRIGFKHSAETKAKMSAMRKGKRKPHSVEHGLAISAGKKLRPMSKEARARLSARRKGAVASLETRQKLSLAGKGKKRAPRSEEWCAKISAAKKGKKLGPRKNRLLPKQYWPVPNIGN